MVKTDFTGIYFVFLFGFGRLPHPPNLAKKSPSFKSLWVCVVDRNLFTSHYQPHTNFNIFN